MSKVAHYLQEHIKGEVMTSPDAREYFSTDGSVFKVTPQMVVYPRNENDVRKTARFSWQLAERGRVFPITARGKGTDQSGGALGQGIVMIFPAHMNKIELLDTKKGSVVIQPGINYGKLQQTLHTHGFFLPPFPASIEYSSVGGAIANNAAGEKTIKYGATRQYVQSLRVVLANGEVIETSRLTKRELSKKMGLSSFEGEVYRALDALITDNKDLIEKSVIGTSKNTAGYALSEVKQKDGSFDLTPLIVGSQGTLGIVTQATMKTEPYNPHTTLVVGYFNDIRLAGDVISAINELQPSAVEAVDDNLLQFIAKHNPNQLKGVIEAPYPKLILLVEFDDNSDRVQQKKAKKARKLIDKSGTPSKMTSDLEEQEDLWKIRHSAAAVMWQTVGTAKALPIIEDGIVPLDKLPAFLDGAKELFAKHNLDMAVWGHAGNANFHMHPFLDLTQVGGRQKVFKLMDEYYDMVINLGGSTAGEHNDGRLRAPYLKKLYGEDMYEVFRKVKQIFDPFGTLNPGVKIDVSIEDIKPLLRNEYSMNHLYDHMPRS